MLVQREDMKRPVVTTKYEDSVSAREISCYVALYCPCDGANSFQGAEGCTVLQVERN